MKNVLLLADDNANFRNTWQKLLSAEGYEVKLASNPQETRDILQNTTIDLAILDLRLESEEETDISGFEIATDKAFRHIPKIVLTGFPISPDNLRKLLEISIDDLPPALSFVDKSEKGLETKLFAAIRHALEVWPHLRISTVKVTTQIRADHQAIRQQAQRNYIVAFVFSLFGFLVICAGILLAWFGQLAVGIVGTTSGLILEALGFLFFTRLDSANERMDIYHTELVQTYWLELLLAACEQLPSESQVTCAERIITTAAGSWFASPSSVIASTTFQQQTAKKP